MNRARRPTKNFVSGGVYDPSKPTQTATPPAAVPAPRNYSYQNTPLAKRASVQAQPKVVPNSSTPQQKVQENVPSTEPPQEVVVKNDEEYENAVVEEQAEAVAVEKVESNAEESNDQTDGDDGLKKKSGKHFFKKIFLNRKKSSVRQKERRIRQNRQLRKYILPKNALMALHEIKGINMGEFIISNVISGGFSALVDVNGSQYEGNGTSKIVAKNNACEQALRDYCLAKMRENPRRASRPNSVSGDTPMETEESAENGEAHDDENDVPMVNLTSFALYKLFSEWEKEGYEIPEFHPAAPQNQAQNTNDADGGSAAAVPKEPKKPTIRNELPPNWETMHPATLLCIMRPGVTYNDYGLEGEKPNTTQLIGCTVDEQEFVGRGRSKKIARRNTAAMVCNGLFGTNFDIEESVAPAAS